MSGEEFFLGGSMLDAGGLGFGSMLSSSSTDSAFPADLFGISAPSTTRPSTFDPLFASVDDTNMSDVEDFSGYNDDMVSPQDDDSLHGFGKLTAIDGDMHVSGHNLKVTRHKHHRHTHGLLGKYDDDDDIWSDNEHNDDSDINRRDDNSNIMNARGGLDDGLVDDVANMRVHTTIEDLLRPPGLPSFAVIKTEPAGGGNDQMGGKRGTRKTVRFSTRTTERFYASEDPAAKANIYAGDPGHEPPSTYIGVPMELIKGLWEPTFKVNTLRTGTSTIRFNTDKPMITTCLGGNGLSTGGSSSNLISSSNMGFDETCEIGIYDLSESSKLKQNRLKKWDRYMNRVDNRQNQIATKLAEIEQKLASLAVGGGGGGGGGGAASNSNSPDQPATPIKPSPNGGDPSTIDTEETKVTTIEPILSESQLKQQLQRLLTKQSLDMTEKQQNILLGGGPFGGGIGIGYYRLLQTIHTPPPLEIDQSTVNPALQIITPIPKVPQTYPIHTIQPTCDVFILQTSHFPSITYQPTTTTTTTAITIATESSSTHPYHNSYIEQVIVATKPRGHCETICTILESRRLQLGPMTITTPTTPIHSRPLPLRNKAFNQALTSPNGGLYAPYIFHANGKNSEGDGDEDGDDDNATMGDSNTTAPKQLKIRDLTIPFHLTTLLTHYRSLHPMFGFYYNNHYGPTSTSSTLSAPQPSIKTFSTDPLTSLAQLYRLDRLAFHTLNYQPSGSSATQTEINIAKQAQMSTLAKRFAPIQIVAQSNNFSLAQQAPVIRLGPTSQPEKSTYRSQQYILTALTPAQQDTKYGNPKNKNKLPQQSLQRRAGPTGITTAGPGGYPMMQDISQLDSDDILFHNTNLESGEYVSLIDPAPAFSTASRGGVSDDSFWDDLDLLTTGGGNRDDGDDGDDGSDPSSLFGGALTPSSSSRQLSRANSGILAPHKPTLREFSLFDAPSTFSLASTEQGMGPAAIQQSQSTSSGGILIPTQLSSSASSVSRPNAPTGLSALTPRFASRSRPASPQNQSQGQGAIPPPAMRLNQSQPTGLPQPPQQGGPPQPPSHGGGPPPFPFQGPPGGGPVMAPPRPQGPPPQHQGGPPQGFNQPPNQGPNLGPSGPQKRPLPDATHPQRPNPGPPGQFQHNTGPPGGQFNNPNQQHPPHQPHQQQGPNNSNNFQNRSGPPPQHHQPGNQFGGPNSHQQNFNNQNPQQFSNQNRPPPGGPPNQGPYNNPNNNPNYNPNNNNQGRRF